MIDHEDAEAVAIAGALRDDYESLCRGAQVPPAGLVWWRATIRARAEAARTAERPITFVQSLAATCVIALVCALVAAAWSSLPDIIVQHAMLLVAALAIGLLVAPLAVLVALGE
jgi:hypothetical protein